MTIRRPTRSSTRPTRSALALACCALLATSSAFAASGGSTPTTTTNVPVPGLDPSLYQPDTTDYDAECEGKTPQTWSGNLTLTTPVQLEDMRCLKYVSGDLTIDTTNDHRGFVLPWLTQVGGDLELEGNGQLDRARLPRLWRVSGEIVVDAFWGNGTAWEAPDLTDHGGRFSVVAGVDTDLRGFDALEDVGTLDIFLPAVNYPINPQSGHLEGLSGLTSVGKLEIDTHAEETTQSGDFLMNLTEVRGTADIRTRYWLVGTDAIETIGGSLLVDVENAQGGANADGLDALREVGGHFEWNETTLYDISALANLESVGGDLELPLSVTSLDGFQSLHTVGGDFTLTGPIDVPNLYALGNLQTVGGEFEVSNSGVDSLFGLSSVTWLGGLRIQGNTGLVNVASLASAYVAPGGSVVIANNAPLTQCQASSLANAMNLSAGVVPVITGNQPCPVWSPAPVEPRRTYSRITIGR